MIYPIESAVARIFRPPRADGTRPAEGAGFLIDDDGHVLTCEHVITACLPSEQRDDSDQIVELDFPYLSPPSKIMTARVDYRVRDDVRDVAGLTLLSPLPAGAHPAVLIERDLVSEGRFKALGFADKSGNGEYSFGVIRSGLGEQYIQLEADRAQGRRIRRGYSGTAVFDLDSKGVAGMVVQADSLDVERVALMLPTKLLLKTWSDVLSRAVIPPNPYKGMRSFEESDEAVYFGRSSWVNEILNVLHQNRFAALVEDSGTGKSSLLKAGLAPAVRRLDWGVLYINGSKRDPYESMAWALLRARGTDSSSGAEATSELATALAKGGIRDELERYCETTGLSTLVILADQLEELFTVCRDDGKREQYLEELSSLTVQVRRDEPRIVVVVALRADYVAAIRRDSAIANLLSAHRVQLSPVDHAGIVEAIVKPAESRGVRFEPGLVDEIVDDVIDETNALPSLEYALTLLWHEQENRVLTAEAYTRLGGVAKAIAGEAERCYGALSGPEKDAARRVFGLLVNLSRDTKGTRRTITEDDLLSGDWAVVEKLALHLLVTIGSNPDGEATAQLTHESMIEAWPRLAAWVESTSEQVWRFDREADRVVRRHVGGAVVAAAIPWVDMPAAVALYANMGQKLSEIYGVEVDGDVRKRIALAMAGGIGVVAASWLTASAFFKSTGFGYIWMWPIEATILSIATYVAGNGWQYYFRIRYLGGGAPTAEDMHKLAAEDLSNRLRKISLAKPVGRVRSLRVRRQNRPRDTS